MSNITIPTTANNEAPAALSVITLPVAYRADAAQLFAELGGTTQPDTALLESADVTTKSGISSLAAVRSALRVTCTDHSVNVQPLTPTGEVLFAALHNTFADYQSTPGTFTFPPGAPLDTMAILRYLQFHTATGDAHATVLIGGFSFDYIDTFEDLPAVQPGPNEYPTYQFVLPEVLLDINHQEGTAQVVGIGIDAGELNAHLCELAERIAATPEQPAEQLLAAGTPAPEVPDAAATTTPATLPVTVTIPDVPFRAHVAALKEYIFAGEIEQVVPSRTFLAACPDAFAAYVQLRAANPSPYMFYLRGIAEGEPFELFGASPESNLKYTAADRQLQLYPIAGTRPRGIGPDGIIDPDLDYRQELDMRTDAKELAEHAMLVELARDDLAQVAAPGTVRVADLLQVDRYSRVMHLVSRVVCTLDPAYDALDAYRACMNMGTVSGAPKLRATELIRAVELETRGSFGGAVGYLRGDGTMDNCIAIRSAFVRGGRAVVQAGAGVVAQSDPQAEANETMHKASAVLGAIAAAQGLVPEFCL